MRRGKGEGVNDEPRITWQMRLFGYGLAVGLSLALVAALPLGFLYARNQARQEYYRGNYDMCRYVVLAEGASDAQSRAFCGGFANAAQGKDWQEQPSTGFDWAVVGAAPTATTRPTPMGAP